MSFVTEIVRVELRLAVVQPVDGDLRIYRFHPVPAVCVLDSDASEVFVNDKVFASLGQKNPVAVTRELGGEQCGEAFFRCEGIRFQVVVIETEHHQFRGRHPRKRHGKKFVAVLPVPNACIQHLI